MTIFQSRWSRRALVGIGALLSGAGALATAGEEPVPDLTPLRAAMEREATDRVEMELDGLKDALKSQDPAGLEQALSAITSRRSSLSITRQVTVLREAVKARQAAEQDRRAKEVEAVLKAVGEAVEAARTAADLDATLEAIDSAQDQLKLGPYVYDKQSEKLNNSRMAVASWQDYLVSLQGGNTQQAIQKLETMGRFTSGAKFLRGPLIAERLETLRAPKAPSAVSLESIMAEAKSLADLPKTIAAVQAIPPPPSGSESVAEMLLIELKKIRASYEDYRNGLPTSVESRPDPFFARTYTDEVTRLAMPLKTQLLRLVVPQALRLPGVIEANETVDQYLQRTFQSAFDLGDARLLARVNELRARLTGASVFPSVPLPLQALLAAQSQELAGQYVPAVVSYERALHLGGDLVSAKAIGGRLDAIKASHPRDYEEGLKVWLSLPPPVAPPTPSAGASRNTTFVVPAASTPSPD